MHHMQAPTHTHFITYLHSYGERYFRSYIVCDFTRTEWQTHSVIHWIHAFLRSFRPSGFESLVCAKTAISRATLNTRSEIELCIALFIASPSAGYRYDYDTNPIAVTVHRAQTCQAWVDLRWGSKAHHVRHYSHQATPLPILGLFQWSELHQIPRETWIRKWA